MRFNKKACSILINAEVPWRAVGKGMVVFSFAGDLFSIPFLKIKQHPQTLSSEKNACVVLRFKINKWKKNGVWVKPRPKLKEPRLGWWLVCWGAEGSVCPADKERVHVPAPGAVPALTWWVSRGTWCVPPGLAGSAWALGDPGFVSSLSFLCCPILLASTLSLCFSAPFSCCWSDCCIQD